MSRLVRVADALGAVALFGLATLLVPAVRVMAWLIRPARSGGGRRILYLGTGAIAQVFPRNGASLFLERECSDFDGFFEQMWNVHFPAGVRGVLDLTPRHHLVDFDVRLPSGLAGLRRTSTALRALAFLGWAALLALRQRVSVVAATNPHLQGLLAWLLSVALGIPYAVLVTRDYDWDWQVLAKQAFPSVFPSRLAEKVVERWVLQRAPLVLADRHFYRAFAVRNGAAPPRVVTTRVLADRTYQRVRTVDPGEVRAHFELPRGPLLAYVGRLDPDKAALDLVETLAAVRERFPHAQLACAGQGALAEPMRQRAEQLGIADGLRFLGTLGADELRALLAAADVVVGANMGYTLVEAGLAGTPVATYDYDWHAEVVRDGETGYLAPFADTAALADRICRALADPAQGTAAGGRARRYLLREHTHDRVIPLYRNAYERLLAAPAHHLERAPQAVARAQPGG